MKPYEFLRLIQEIGIILNLSAPTISHRFIKSNTRQYKSEIVVTACFYLVGKMVEDQKRIRDILVVISLVIKLYRQANAKIVKQEGDDPIQYVSLVDFETENLEFFDSLVPNMDLDSYKRWKNEVLEAEQNLLRIINYDLKNETFENYLMIMNYIKIFNFEQPLRQITFDVFQDTFFLEFDDNMSNLDLVKGSLYLGITLHRQHCLAHNIQIKLKQEFMNVQWWEEMMQIQYQKLLQFQVEMMEYYKSTKKEQ
ncbi:hypothetical protein pb186bvf_014578 [Paramecium bursaria]